MTTQASEPNIHSWVVKIWVEETSGESDKSIWRGHITHVLNGERCYVKSLEEIKKYFLQQIKFIEASF